MNMKKVSVFLIALMSFSIILTGCSYLEDTGNEEYIEESQENAPDNEELIEYIEKLKPVIEIFYEGDNELKDLSVSGNSVYILVNVGKSPEPFKDFKDLMIYETTRITNAIYSYREDNPVLTDIYKISVDFEDQKKIILYGKQTVEVDGNREFKSQTILNAVKN